MDSPKEWSGAGGPQAVLALSAPPSCASQLDALLTSQQGGVGRQSPTYGDTGREQIVEFSIAIHCKCIQLHCGPYLLIALRSLPPYCNACTYQGEEVLASPSPTCPKFYSPLPPTKCVLADPGGLQRLGNAGQGEDACRCRLGFHGASNTSEISIVAMTSHGIPIANSHAQCPARAPGASAGYDAVPHFLP